MVAPRAARFYSSALMRTLVRIFVRFYQATLSPLLSALTGPLGGCRFSPSCSEYFLQAVQQHGFWRGSWFGGKRLLRCHPWGGSGSDPVPPPARYVLR